MTQPILKKLLSDARVQLALILLAGLVAYANSFSGPFLYDDYVVIVNEPNIHNFNFNWKNWRMLTDLTYMANYHLHGLETFGYHFVNLLVHLVNGMLVYAMTTLLLNTPKLKQSSLNTKAREIAFFAALLFTLHPIQTQAVTYIAQRYTSMAALFYVAAVCIYILFRNESSRSNRKWFYYAGFLLAVLLAFRCKQNTATLPLAVLLVEMIFFSGTFKKRLIYFSPFILGCVAVAGYIVANDFNLPVQTRIDTTMSRADYLLTQFSVIATYLRLLVFPVGQNLDYDYPLFNSLFQPEVLASFILHIGLIATAIYCLFKSQVKPHFRLLSFGIFWFYLTLSIESSILPIVDVIYEHRVYLPSAGIFIAAAIAFYSTPKFRDAKTIQATVIIILALTLGVTTFNRNKVWQSSFALWSDIASKSPNKARPLNNLGTEYFKQGEYEKALSYFLKAIEKDRKYMKAYFNTGETYQNMGNLQQALIYYRSFMSAWPDYPETYKNIADIYKELGQEEQAARHMEFFNKLNTRSLSKRYR